MTLNILRMTSCGTSCDDPLPPVTIHGEDTLRRTLCLSQTDVAHASPPVFTCSRETAEDMGFVAKGLGDEKRGERLSVIIYKEVLRHAVDSRI